MESTAVWAVVDPVFGDHDPGAGHPERPERILALVEMVRTFPYRDEIQLVSPRPGTWQQAGWVHAAEYLDLLKETSGFRTALDSDTHTSADSIQVALVAAGSAVALAEKVCDTGKPGFAMIRPPGHHAERDRAMGFCFLNNVAIVAEWALREAGARRVAVIDFDVHHGNGTQSCFYNRDDVLYVSSHQFPYYPGSGAMGESGADRGTGFTINFPLERGSGDETFVRIYENLVPVILEQYRPDWILVSAGYDAHKDDPLAQLEVSRQGFARVVQSLQRCAQDLCDSRIVYLLEGGYNLEALTESVRQSLAVILRKSKPEPEPLAEPKQWRDYLSGLRRFCGRWHF